MTKTEITGQIKHCQDYGYQLTIFQTDRKKRKQEKGFPDYHLIGREGIIYLEGKVDDKLSEEQKKLLVALRKVMNTSAHVFAGIVTGNNCKEIVDSIICGLTHKLRKILNESFDKYLDEL